MILRISSLLVLCFLLNNINAQRTILRGNIYDLNDGNSVPSATVFLDDDSEPVLTDENGFFAFYDLTEGRHQVKVTYVGYDTLIATVDIKPNVINYKKFYLVETSTLLDEVKITTSATQKRTEVNAGVINIKPKEIKALPSIGGDADIAQYLPVLPGIVSTGDQGGQIYIRGGSPVQNMILLDGMTIFNPFHSIGLFSVFETEAIKSVEVMSAGFNVEHGGRMSAVVDINTKEGNKKRFGGMVGASPFAGRVLLEGPIVKLKPDKPFSSSFLLTTKRSFLDKTSKSLYSYANEDGLPFYFEDYYGKLNLSLDNGSKIDFFGFNFKDKVDYNSTSKFNWKNRGGGANFNINPANSSIGIGGTINVSQYGIELAEESYDPRTSDFNNFMFGINITKYNPKSQLNVGVEVISYGTNLKYTNFLNTVIQVKDNSSELAAYIKYKYVSDRLVVEPGFRIHYYSAISSANFEPRIGVKYNATNVLRFKAAGGVYSQNLLSTIDDRDVVNLFNGFLTGSDESVYDPFQGANSNKKMQVAYHGLFGIEYDLTPFLELNLEPYIKIFDRLLNLNRGKKQVQEANYLMETGKAYGIDLTAKYSKNNYYFWGTYSYAKVTRNDGTQEYPTIFDRTHNVNLLGSVAFGKKRDIELSLRWNFGTGFPFTRAIGFYEQLEITDIETNFPEQNGAIGVVYESKRNQGRLTDYHRLDFSVKKTFRFSNFGKAELSASVTNLYNRDNLFYFNRLTYERVNQLPIMPSMALNIFF